MNNTSCLIPPIAIKCLVDATEHVLWCVPSASSAKAINERSYSIHIEGEIEALNVRVVVVIFVAYNGDADLCFPQECKIDVADNTLNLLLGSIDMTRHRCRGIDEEEQVR